MQSAKESPTQKYSLSTGDGCHGQQGSRCAALPAPLTFDNEKLNGCMGTLDNLHKRPSMTLLAVLSLHHSNLTLCSVWCVNKSHVFHIRAWA